MSVASASHDTRGGGMRRAAGEPLARAGARLLAVAALLVVSLVRWFDQLSEADDGRAVLFALTAAVVAAALTLTGRLADARARSAALVIATLLLLGGALLVAGVPLWMLDPRDWGAALAGFADGIGALPGTTVPYRGVNDWVRVTIASGGTLLVALAALAAGWPRRGGRVGARAWTIVALGVLFGVPAAQLTAAQPWVLGALFALPLCLFLVADRLPVRLAALGGGVLLGAVVMAMVVAPVIDGDGPIVDVEELASALEDEQANRFNWNQSYGPMDWPRDGREVMRVQARRASYWKADDLELFDGIRWAGEPGANPLTPIAEGLDAHPNWRQEVRVTIEGMQTRQFVAPGETLSISRAPRQPINTRAGGFSVPMDKEGLSNGDAYLAESYVPRPGAAALRAAGTAYPGFLGDQFTMLTPTDGSTGRTLIRFLPFGSGGAPLAAGPGVGADEAVLALQEAGYGEVYALAQELAADAATPYDFVRRVERYLGGAEFIYEEQVPERQRPLASFLFRDKAGYCQQYSGAMALLLRMGGVPTRVSAGFTAGELDRERREYVVRDTDAHSWVEVWFPEVGWVAFDPTPSVAPARSQSDGAALGDPSVVPGGPQPSGAVGRGADLGPGGEAAALPSVENDSGPPWGALVAVVVAIAVAARGCWALWRRRRARAADDQALPADLAELERALRRTGRPLSPGTTLLQLEQRFAHRPGARAYLRALSARRYGAGGAGPGRAERRALRRDLAGGLGFAGRLRVLWALPPRLRWR